MACDSAPFHTFPFNLAPRAFAPTAFAPSGLLPAWPHRPADSRRIAGLFVRTAAQGALAIRLIALMTAILFPTFRAEAEPMTFKDATPGQPPTGFAFARTGQGANGKWLIVRDETIAAGVALEQQSPDRTDNRFPLAIYEPVSAKNVEVSVRFKPVAGAVDRAGGIAVRLADADNYYVARANALEDNVRFYHVVKGRRTELKSANLKVSANAWHTLELKAEGDRFTVSFDGKQLYTVTDTTLAQAGKVALWTKADSVTRFDALDIRPLP